MLYSPTSFKSRSEADNLEIISTYPFATLITVDADGMPQLSHCPMVYQIDAQGAWLEGHIARANPHHLQWKENQPALVVFNGPDAYVSPSWYVNMQNVPTWNYIVVHVKGVLRKEEEQLAKDHLLKRLIAHLEPSYDKQWRGLSPDYQQRMLQAIVGFKIKIHHLEGKFKLSQNRLSADVKGVLDGYAAGNEKQRALGVWMKRVMDGL